MIKKYSVLFFLFADLAAADDTLLQAMSIASYGNRFQADRLRVAAENLANQDTTAATPGADPYVRKILYAVNIYDRKIKARIVRAEEGLDRLTPFHLRYLPNHPAADSQGYVKFPNVDAEIERADANEAQRSYEANLGMMMLAKDMIERTMELMK